MFIFAFAFAFLHFLHFFRNSDIILLKMTTINIYFTKWEYAVEKYEELYKNHKKYNSMTTTDDRFPFLGEIDINIDWSRKK